MPPSSERREYQRLQLETPIKAVIDTVEVSITDIGIGGAGIEHASAIPPRGTMKFRWGNEEIVFRVEARRSEHIRPLVWSSGVEFVGPVGRSDELLRELMSEEITRIVRRQKAERMKIAPRRAEDPDPELTQLVRRKSHAPRFIVCRLTPGGWIRTESSDPRQPADGFTVATDEAQERVNEICRAYEQSDIEGRRMIRLSAEMSLSRKRTP